MAVSVQHVTIGHVRRLTCSVIAEPDGSVPATVLPSIEGHLLAIVSTPGSPAPSANWSAYLRDQSQWDLLEGAGESRSASATQKAVVRYPGKDVHPCVDESDRLVLSIAGNSVPAAAFAVSIIYGLGAGR